MSSCEKVSVMKFFFSIITLSLITGSLIYTSITETPSIGSLMINIVYENKTKLKECELSIKHRSNDISQSNSSNSKFINITSPLPITYAQNSIELCYNIIKGSVQIFIDNIINTTALPSGSKIENLTDGFHNITIVLLSENEFTSKSYVIFRV